MLSPKATAVIAYAIAIDCLLFFDTNGALLAPTPPVFLGCSKRHFDCMSVPAQCVPHEQVCNGRNDCANGEDESLDVCGKTECTVHDRA